MSESDDVDHAKIARVFKGELATSSLNAEEQKVWIEEFVSRIAQPGPDEDAFFATLRSSGEAVGIDENRDIAHAKPGSEIQLER